MAAKGVPMSTNSASVEINNKRERIMMAASDLIAEKGLQATTMAEIAKEAGVANGTAYLYFDSKQDLVRAIYKQLMDEIAETVLPYFSVGATVKERFFSFWCSLLEHHLRVPQKAKLLVYLNVTPYVDEAFREKASAELNRSQADFFKATRDEGLIKDVPLGTVVWFIYGSLLFLVGKENVRQRLAGNKKAIRQVVQMWWDAIQV